MAKSINIAFPISDDVADNRLFSLNTTYKDAIKSDFLFLMFTEKGKRWKMPDFGTDLRRNVFEPNDEITQEAILKDIQMATTKYLPSVRVTGIEMEDGENEHQVIMTIHFTYSIRGLAQESDFVVLNLQ